MNLRDLQYLTAVAKYRHFGKAAEACFVSQPTLSTQIKKLEEELGVTLIERDNKSVILTDIGHKIVAKAQQTLQAVDEMRDIASLHNDPQAGTFRLGIIPTLAPYVLPHIMPVLQTRFPKLRLLLYEYQTAVLLKKLPAGDVDAALLALPIADPNLKFQLLFKEPFFAAVPNNHRLADRNTIQLDELDKQGVLLLEDGHCLRDQALDICREVGATETEGFRATSLETLRQMVCSGTGMTFMPALATVNSLSDPSIVRYIPFNNPTPDRSIAIFYRSSSHRENVITTMGDIIKEKINTVLNTLP